MQLRFASCNILFDDGKSKPGWQLRSGLLRDSILEWQPDILATQEGRKEQLFQLRDLLAPDYELLDAHRDWHDVKMYPCLFVRRDKFVCRGSYDRWLSETPEIAHSQSFGSRWPKLANLACLEAGGQDFTVASFHFDNVEAKARPRQAEVLLREMAKVGKAGPGFLLGDANDLASSDTLQIIRSGGYQDPWSWQPQPHTFHGFSAPEGGVRIDYILHKGDVILKNTFCL